MAKSACRPTSPDSISISKTRVRPPARLLHYHSSAGHNRQLRDHADAGPSPPTNLRWLDRQSKLRPACEQRLQGASPFDARELVAEAEMNSGAEREMPVRPPLEIEPFGALVRLRIEIRGDDHRHHPV